jgi:hypothetical protein
MNRNMLRKGHTLMMVAVLACTLMIMSTAEAIPWMFEPTNESHGLSNTYLEIQDYGGQYYHDGIDVIKPTGAIPVYSVSDGWMTHETYGVEYGGLMIGNSYAAGDSGWLYWHLPSSTYPFNVGDRIYEGDYIGDIAYWPVSDFHHVHFNAVVGTGGLPWGWYTSIDNPMDWLEPTTDDFFPVIYDAVGTDLLAFCVDNTSNYLNPNSLQGDVDIITKIGDLSQNRVWDVAPYRIEYSISGGTVYEHHTSFVLTGWQPPSNTLLTVYKDDATCNSGGNYEQRDFFFIVTNHDDDEIIEYDDRNGHWNTAGYPNGAYTVTVDAWDAGGNLTQGSMQVNLIGSEPRDVTITLTPTGSTQLPSSGGTITFEVAIANQEANSVTFDGWIEMTYPDSSVVQLIHRQITLPVGGSINRQLTLTVAGSEPDGWYYLEGKVGYHPYNHWSASGFNFSKGLDLTAGGVRIEETRLDGWDDLTRDVGTSSVAQPQTAALLSCYPNPFNPSTSILFSLPAKAKVELAIYDITGRLVTELVDGWRDSGIHEVTFDASQLASGIYVYQMQAGEFSASGKMVLMK